MTLDITAVLDNSVADGLIGVHHFFIVPAASYDRDSSVFDGVPDFSSELIASSQDGEIEWGEWYWHGHHVDGSPFAMPGTTIFAVRDGLIAEGRLYMEPAETDGGDIEAAVQELYKPPPGSPH